LLGVATKFLRSDTKAYCDDKGVKKFGAFLFSDRRVTLIRLGGNLIKVDRAGGLGFYSILNAVKAPLGDKDRQTRVKSLFIASVFLFFSVFSAYLNYNYCVHADLPSSEPSLETFSQDYLLADELHKFEISWQSLLPRLFENTGPRRLLPSFEESPYDREPVILRC
jgi:hypothetical protein